MEFELLGYPPDGPTLTLDHEQFAYAGKFVMSNTGKVVARDAGRVVGAVAFNADHADPETARLRYVTVQEGYRGEGIGPRLLRFSADELTERFEQVCIAVNNPVAYQACYRAGFVSTGEETGIAELLMRYDPETRRNTERYTAGFYAFEREDLPPTQRAVLERHTDSDPPPVVDSPDAHDS